VDALFAASVPRVTNAPIGRAAFAGRVAAGGYPEVHERDARRRDRWFSSYLTTTFERDLRAISDLHKGHEMRRLLSVLATRSGNLLRYASVANALEIDQKTVKSYIELLQAIFLVQTLPAWRPSFLARVVHAPKVYITDSGLLAHLLGADEQRLAEDDRVTGLALETFVAMEVMKHAGWSEVDPRVYHSATAGVARSISSSRIDPAASSRSRSRLERPSLRRTPQCSPSCATFSASSSSRASSFTRASRLFRSATAYGPFPSADYGRDQPHHQSRAVSLA
jgi:hypothetical protein